MPDKLNTKTGLLASERDAILAFCLSDEYPRTLTIGSGTRYQLRTPIGAYTLYKRLGGKQISSVFPQVKFDRKTGKLIVTSSTGA